MAKKIVQPVNYAKSSNFMFENPTVSFLIKDAYLALPERIDSIDGDGLPYHSGCHTLEVCAAVCNWSPYHPDITKLMMLAALYHDIGFEDAFDGQNHEEISIKKFLNEAGKSYPDVLTPLEKEFVCSCIMGTKFGMAVTMPQQIMADADLSYLLLDPKEVTERTQALRNEIKIYHKTGVLFHACQKDEDWLRLQQRFIADFEGFKFEPNQSFNESVKAKGLEVQKLLIKKYRLKPSQI